jgi:hypothetical protein
MTTGSSIRLRARVCARASARVRALWACVRGGVYVGACAGRACARGVRAGRVQGNDLSRIDGLEPLTSLRELVLDKNKMRLMEQPVLVPPPPFSHPPLPPLLLSHKRGSWSSLSWCLSSHHSLTPSPPPPRSPSLSPRPYLSLRLSLSLPPSLHLSLLPPLAHRRTHERTHKCTRSS